MKLICDDCFNYMPLLEDKSVDLILCDLPYGISACRWDKVLPFNKLWVQYERIIKDHGAILLFAQSPFDKILACSNSKFYRYEWIWVKTRATGHLNANRMPLKAHENILVFYKQLPKFYPQKTIAETPVNSFTKRVDVQNHCQIYGKTTKEITGGGNYERYPRDVLFFAKDSSNYHPTQKPLALCEFLIKTYTTEKDVVLDNCMGSGSVGVAAINTRRDFIGIEIDKSYFDIAQKRICSALKNKEVA